MVIVIPLILYLYLSVAPDSCSAIFLSSFFALLIGCISFIDSSNKMSSYETYYIKEETNYTSRLLASLQDNLEEMSVHQLKQYLQSY